MINALLFGRERSRLRVARGLQLLLRRRFLRQRVFAVVLSPECALCRILGRLKLYVDPNDFGISHHIMADGIWEQRTTEIVVDRVTEGSTAIDVGANLGYFALLMADLVGPSGRVIACEPNPAMVERIGRSAMVNGFADRVAVHDRPISDENGRAVVLSIPVGQPGGGQIDATNPGDAQLVDCRTLRLDSVPGALDAAFVKIDVEGHEAAVWRGMAAMIAAPALRAVVLEFSPASHVDPGAFLDGIEAARFSIRLIDERDGPVRVDRATLLDPRRPISQLLLRR